MASNSLAARLSLARVMTIASLLFHLSGFYVWQFSICSVGFLDKVAITLCIPVYKGIHRFLYPSPTYHFKYLTFAFAGGRGLNVELDPCLSNPCLNRGECIQLRFGRYKCECTGTNFYGEKCQKGKRKHRVIVNVEFQAKITFYSFCVFYQIDI